MVALQTFSYTKAYTKDPKCFLKLHGLMEFLCTIKNLKATYRARFLIHTCKLHNVCTTRETLHIPL